jgi:hypothetical protein
VFSQALDGGHEDVVVAQEVLEDELREGVPETRVFARILGSEKVCRKYKIKFDKM